MNVAFLVLAHTDPAQLLNLVRRLSPNQFFDSNIFLHIDKKSNFSEFEFLGEFSHVELIKRRVDVIRCGISQVDASLELMKNALQFGKRFDRYVLITGQDYPIVSNSELYKKFSDYEIEYMRAYRLSGTDMNKKVSKYYFYNKFFTSSAFGNSMRKMLQLIVFPFNKKDTVMIDGKRCPIYYSSAYFAVTHELLCELYIKGKDKKYYNYFKTAITSDELYFVTIAANSRFRNNLEMIETDSRTLLYNSSITYFDYHNRPKVLTKKDYAEIVNSKRLFARKFSSEQSEQLMLKLDEKSD